MENIRFIDSVRKAKSHATLDDFVPVLIGGHEVSDRCRRWPLFHAKPNLREPSLACTEARSTLELDHFQKVEHEIQTPAKARFLGLGEVSRARDRDNLSVQAAQNG